MTPAAGISRVLVGVDFDEASASALKLAGVFASAWDAHVTVLHSAAHDVPAYFTADQIEALEIEREQGRAGLADHLRAFAGPHLAGAADVIVDEGLPQDAIVRMAPAFDLIVVGSHRRQGTRRWWLGSVAESVVRLSTRPVLVMPSGAQVPGTDRPISIFVVGDDHEVTEPWIEVLRRTFLGHVVRFPLIHKCPSERLHNADLIVVAMPRETGADGRFDVVVQLLRDCVRPVLFVPSAAGLFEGSRS
jgi:nucleotide-binding universal stress UspA family protein